MARLFTDLSAMDDQLLGFVLGLVMLLSGILTAALLFLFAPLAWYFALLGGIGAVVIVFFALAYWLYGR